MVRGRILCAFVGEPAMLTPPQSSRTNVKSSGAAAPDWNCVRNLCTSRACATITPLAVGAPTIAMTATNESPAIGPLPSHATPENVRRTPNAPISLDFEVTDSLNGNRADDHRESDLYVDDRDLSPWAPTDVRDAHRSMLRQRYLFGNCLMIPFESISARFSDCARMVSNASTSAL